MFGVFGRGFFSWQKSTWQAFLVTHQLTVNSMYLMPTYYKKKSKQGPAQEHPDKMPKAPEYGIE